jgi:hypothetical protein
MTKPTRDGPTTQDTLADPSLAGLLKRLGVGGTLGIVDSGGLFDITRIPRTATTGAGRRRRRPGMPRLGQCAAGRAGFKLPILD